VGGYITDNFSWRWIFYINMPVGGAALLYLAATMRVARHRVEHKIDYAGAVTLAVAATAIILMTTWGGTQYAWGSAQIIGLAARRPGLRGRGPPSRFCRCTCSATATSRLPSR